MKRVLIIGAGELGQQIAHYLSESAEHTIVGYVDDWANTGDIFCGYPVLGCIKDTEMLYHQRVFDELLIGIGYKHFNVRKQLFDQYKSIIPFATYLHSSSYIDSTSRIGSGVVVLPGCVIDYEAVLQDNLFVYSGCVIGHNTQIGAHSILSLSVTTGGFSQVGDSCFLGLKTCVSDNVIIANHTFCGAGTNVIKDILVENGVWVGNPARYIRENK